MKWLVITLLITSLDSFAKIESPLLVCLGNEEKKFHLAKAQGPVYELNQKLISEIIQIPSAQIDNQELNLICQNNSGSPSIRLIGMTLSKGEKLFKITSGTPESQKLIAEGMIKDFVEISREIFLNFVSSIQAIAPTPTCLEEEIPELKKLYEDLKYLQDEVELRKLFEGKENEIFEKLQNYSEAFKKCQTRTKKKLNSASVPASKKD